MLCCILISDLHLHYFDNSSSLLYSIQTGLLLPAIPSSISLSSLWLSVGEGSYKLYLLLYYRYIDYATPVKVVKTSGSQLWPHYWYTTTESQYCYKKMVLPSRGYTKVKITFHEAPGNDSSLASSLRVLIQDSTICNAKVHRKIPRYWWAITQIIYIDLQVRFPVVFNNRTNNCSPSHWSSCRFHPFCIYPKPSSPWIKDQTKPGD